MCMYACKKMTATAAERRPDAEILGVTVQKMVTFPTSFELILGTKKDPIFGSVIMVGTGGTAAELFRDRALGLPPARITGSVRFSLGRTTTEADVERAVELIGDRLSGG